MRILRPVALKRRPVVSVVIPCYNYGRYLPEAVASVLDQRGVDLDVLIVDDASTDGSQRVALDLAEAHECIRVLVHDRNMGHIATYNEGLSQVVGDYVVLLSADDMLTPGSLGRSVALLEACPEVGLVYGYAMEFTDSVPPLTAKRPGWAVWTGEDWLRTVCRKGSNVIVNPEVVMRRSVMDQLDGYRADMPHAADLDLWLRAACRADIGRVNGPIQALYRVHGSNMHLTDYRGLLTDLRARREVFDQLAVVPDAARLKTGLLAGQARRALAGEALREAAHLVGAHQSPAAVTELARFALETDGDVEKSPLWGSLQRRQRRPSSTFRQSLSGSVYRWRWALRWRRWRRFGI